MWVFAWLAWLRVFQNILITINYMVNIMWVFAWLAWLRVHELNMEFMILGYPLK